MNGTWTISQGVRQKLLILIQVNCEVKVTSRGTANYKYTFEIYLENPNTNLFYFVDLTAVLRFDL